MAKNVQPLEPLPGYVILKEYKLEEKIAGRLIMPTDAQNKPSLGEVIDIGEPYIMDEKVHLAEPDLDPGDIVAYQNYGGQELTLDNVKYLVVPFDKIIAKINIRSNPSG